MTVTFDPLASPPTVVASRRVWNWVRFVFCAAILAVLVVFTFADVRDPEPSIAGLLLLLAMTGLVAPSAVFAGRLAAWPRASLVIDEGGIETAVGRIPWPSLERIRRYSDDKDQTAYLVLVAGSEPERSIYGSRIRHGGRWLRLPPYCGTLLHLKDGTTAIMMPIEAVDWLETRRSIPLGEWEQNDPAGWPTLSWFRRRARRT